MKKMLATQCAGILLATLAGAANAGAISILRDSAQVNLAMGVDLPPLYNDNYGIADWSFNDNYLGAGIDGARLYGEKYYGVLPEADESTWMYGYAEIANHSAGEYSAWSLRTKFDVNNEPNPGVGKGEGSILWQFVFDVTGEDVSLQIESWADAPGGAVLIVVVDFGSGASYAYELSEYATVDLLDGHRYSLSAYSHFPYTAGNGDGSQQINLQFNATTEAFATEPASGRTTWTFP